MLLRVLLPCLCTFALVSPAIAEDPQVAPDSPAGTEYQLPLQRAREQAGVGAGGSAGSGGEATSGTAPLFGAGVGDEKSRAAASRSGATRRRDDSDPAIPAEREKETSAARIARAQAPAPDDASGAAVAIAGGAGGVLLLGGLAGLAWRRRAEQPDT
jgi:hypothetical protein